MYIYFGPHSDAAHSSAEYINLTCQWNIIYGSFVRSCVCVCVYIYKCTYICMHGSCAVTLHILLVQNAYRSAKLYFMWTNMVLIKWLSTHKMVMKKTTANCHEENWVLKATATTTSMTIGRVHVVDAEARGAVYRAPRQWKWREKFCVAVNGFRQMWFRNLTDKHWCLLHIDECILYRRTVHPSTLHTL